MKIQDRQYLLTQQYKDPSNLNARIRLHELFSTNPQGIHAWMFDQFALPENCTMLELGCGPATLWQENLTRVSAGWRATLTDFSPGMVAAAQQALAGQPNFTIEQVDAQNLPYPDATFDVVMAHYMLYHVPDRPRALAEIARVLKPGGKFYAMTIGAQHLKEIFEIMRDFDSEWREGHVHTPFTLENGGPQIAPFFSNVELRLYEDSLAITETEPLIQYMRSMSRLSDVDWTDEKITALRAQLETRLTQHGVLHVRKDNGMFIAEKAQ
ncbi:MAG: class I SAM-dependent methyltransferase [Anaerolineales bacterium]|nr:class I SAM-dependent methyltransferase [Anaerolineales bacterium]